MAESALFCRLGPLTGPIFKHALQLGLVLSLLAARLSAASLVATLDQNTTQPGEPVTLSLSFEGAKPANPPALPAIPNLSASYLGQSSQIQVINGRTSSSVSFNYAVMAAQPGEYTIPAFQVRVGNETLTTQPLKLVVGKGDPQLAQIAFLRLHAPKADAYVGEAMVLEIRLYAQGGRLAQLPQLKGDGVTFGKPIPAGNTQVLTNGIAYQLVTYQVPVTFVKTGEFALTAGDCLLDVQFRSTNRRRSPFGLDSMFDDVFGTETRRLNLTSEPLTMRVQSLPATGVPPDFNGAVGEFTLDARISTNVVAAGDPITLTVRLAGLGPVETLKWEAPATWNGFKTYPPSTQVTNSDASGLVGVKTFEQAVIPEGPQVKEIPPITFSFFDPVQRRYRSLSHPATPITVQPAAVMAAQPMVVTGRDRSEAPPPPATDLVPLKTRPGALAQIAPPWIERPGFFALQLVPLALWLSALAWRRWADRLARDPRLRRRQHIVRLVREGLVELREAAAANRGEAFYAAVFRLLQEQLGERLDLPASAITEAVVEERLQPLGLDAELLADTRDLFLLCNQARYAPSQQAGELAALLPKVEATLRRIQAISTDAKR
jgi:hypothetical protein